MAYDYTATEDPIRRLQTQGFIQHVAVLYHVFVQNKIYVVIQVPAGNVYEPSRIHLLPDVVSDSAVYDKRIVNPANKRRGLKDDGENVCLLLGVFSEFHDHLQTDSMMLPLSDRGVGISSWKFDGIGGLAPRGPISMPSTIIRIGNFFTI